MNRCYSTIRRALESDDKKLRATAIATLKQYPDELIGSYLDEVGNAVKQLTDNEVGQQLLLNDASRMRKQLYEGREATAVSYAECLLIERVIACRFVLNCVESKAAESASLSVAEYWQRTLERAHKRYLSSLKALAEVRRLALPSVSVALPGSTQVNIGEKQVNLSLEANTLAQQPTILPAAIPPESM